MSTGFYEDTRKCSLKINSTRISWRWCTFPKGVSDDRICYVINSKSLETSERQCLILLPLLISERTCFKKYSFLSLGCIRNCSCLSKLDSERFISVLTGSKGILYSINFKIPFTHNDEKVLVCCNGNVSLRYCSYSSSQHSERYFFIKRFIKGQLINISLNIPVTKNNERSCICAKNGISAGDYRICNILFTSYNERQCYCGVSLKNILITCKSHLNIKEHSDVLCSYSVLYSYSHRYCSILTSINGSNGSGRFCYVLIKNEKIDERKCSFSVIQKSILYNINVIPAPYWWSNRHCFVKYIQHFSERYCKACEKNITKVSRSQSSPIDLVVVSSSDTTVTLRLVSNGLIDYINGDYILAAVKDVDNDGDRNVVDIIYSLYDSDKDQTVTEFTISAFSTDGSAITLNEEISYNLIGSAKYELNILKVSEAREEICEKMCYLSPISIINFDYIYQEGNPTIRQCSINIALKINEWTDSVQDTNWCDYNYEWID